MDQRKLLALQSQHFKFITDHLYGVGGDGQLRECVPPHQIEALLAKAHQGISGGYFASDVTARNILYSRLWW